jgi:hypothetical protein
MLNWQLEPDDEELELCQCGDCERCIDDRFLDTENDEVEKWFFSTALKIEVQPVCCTPTT